MAVYHCRWQVELLFKELKSHINFDGIFDYWIGFKNGEPFCLMMSNKVSVDDDILELWKTNLSSTGNTVSLDFMIGEEAFLGKGLAAIAINTFIAFYLSNIDAKTDIFLIDPDRDNKKALRAYDMLLFYNERADIGIQSINIFHNFV
nr:GNAT family N-acetyltransferase [Photorhabdus temperata]